MALSIKTVALVLALPSISLAKPSFTSRAANAALDDGLAVSGVQLQRKRANNDAKRIESHAQLDREERALWVGLQLRSGHHQLGLHVDVLRLATSALPGGRSVRAVASGAFFAWDLLQQSGLNWNMAGSIHRQLQRRPFLAAHPMLWADDNRLLTDHKLHPIVGFTLWAPRKVWPEEKIFAMFWPYDLSQDVELRRLVRDRLQTLRFRTLMIRKDRHTPRSTTTRSTTSW